MTWFDLPLKPTTRALRQFAGSWLVLFVILALRQSVARHHPASGWVFAAIALVGLLGLLKPAAVRWIFIGATVAVFPIGWAVTQTVLAVMFYLVLTPLAVLFRLRGRDELRLRGKPEESSLWIERKDPPKPERYLKQY